MTITEQIANAKVQELLTVEQFALLAQFAPKTVYKKVERGEIPGVVRFGRVIRFRKIVALAWVVNHPKHGLA